MLENQEHYLQSLKKIKEVEENAQKEIEDYRKKIESEINQLQSDLESAITSAKQKGEELVDSSIETARTNATSQTTTLIEDAKIKSENITSEIHAQDSKKILEILLKGVE